MTIRIRDGDLVIEAGSFGKTDEKRHDFKTGGLSGPYRMWDADRTVAVDEEDVH